MIRAKYVLAFMSVVCSTAVMAQSKQTSSFTLNKITGEAMVEQYKQFWRDEIQYEEKLAAHIKQQERNMPASAKTARSKPEYYGFVHEVAKGYRLIFTQYRSDYTCNGDGACQLKVIFQSPKQPPKIVVQNLTADMRSLSVVLASNRNPSVKLASFGVGPVMWNYDVGAGTYRKAPANENIVVYGYANGQTRSSIFSAAGDMMASVFRSIGEWLPSDTGAAYAQSNIGAVSADKTKKRPENCLSPIDYATYSGAVFRLDSNSVNCVENVTQTENKYSDSTVYLASTGTVVPAVADGVVDEIGDDPLSSGIYIVVKNDDGRTATYMNLDKNIRVRKDDAVKRGQPVGTVGSAGGGVEQPHVRLRIANANGFRICPEVYARECINDAMIRKKRFPAFGAKL